MDVIHVVIFNLIFIQHQIMARCPHHGDAKSLVFGTNTIVPRCQLASTSHWSQVVRTELHQPHVTLHDLGSWHPWTVVIHLPGFTETIFLTRHSAGA